MSEGYIKLYRKIKDNGLWDEKPFSRGQAWIDVLLHTSYEPSAFWVRGICVKTEPGQCAMSQLTMSKRWGWSRCKVQTFLKHLENEQQIRQEKTNVTCLISITNWKDYQENKHQNRHQQGTNKAPNRHNKEGKEGKEKNIHGGFVSLTDEEHENLITKYGRDLTTEYIERLNEYIGSKGKRYKSHYMTILSWFRKDNIKPLAEKKLRLAL